MILLMYVRFWQNLDPIASCLDRGGLRKTGSRQSGFKHATPLHTHAISYIMSLRMLSSPELNPKFRLNMPAHSRATNALRKTAERLAQNTFSDRVGPYTL